MYSCSRIVRAVKIEAPVVVAVREDRPGRAEGAKEASPTDGAANAAAAILEEARAEAQHLLAAAQAEAGRIRQAAREHGLQEARLIARQESETSLMGQVEALKAIAASIAEERRQILAASERELVALATAIAGRVVRGQAAVDQAIVQAVVSAALARVGAEESVRLLVNPDDLEAVRAVVGERALADDGRQAEIVADESITRGGCLVRVGSGTVDARIESQFAEVVGFFDSMLREV